MYLAYREIDVTLFSNRFAKKTSPVIRFVVYEDFHLSRIFFQENGSAFLDFSNLMYRFDDCNLIGQSAACSPGVHQYPIEFAEPAFVQGKVNSLDFPSHTYSLCCGLHATASSCIFPIIPLEPALIPKTPQPSNRRRVADPHSPCCVALAQGKDKQFLQALRQIGGGCCMETTAPVRSGKTGKISKIFYFLINFLLISPILVKNISLSGMIIAMPRTASPPHKMLCWYIWRA